MKSYERIFGSGPRGAIISTIMFLVAYFLEDHIGFSQIFTNNALRYSLVTSFSGLGVVLIVWSLISLPVKERGRKLVVTGAFRFFRHPLYAAFLIFFNVGFALYLNNWLYIFWAVLLFPIWSLIIRSEEKLMINTFGNEYEAYCRKTGQFTPKLW